MKEIKQGTIYGFEVVIKVPLENTSINQDTLENYIRCQSKSAVDKYVEESKDKVFFENIKKTNKGFSILSFLNYVLIAVVVLGCIGVVIALLYK